MTIEQISVVIAALAAIASAFAAWYSKKSAEISRNTLEYSQTPILTLEYDGSCLVLRNIGLGIARDVYWSGDENINMPSPRLCFIPILLPYQGLLKEILREGNESIAKRIGFGMLNNSDSGVVTIMHKNFTGKKFESKILVTHLGEHQYKIQILSE